MNGFNVNTSGELVYSFPSGSPPLHHNARTLQARKFLL